MLRLWALVFALVGLVPSLAHSGVEPGNKTVTGSINACTDTGAANAYSCAFPFPLTAGMGYQVNTFYAFKAANANTGASTVNFGPGVINLKRFVGGSKTPLIVNDIGVGQTIVCYYDGTDCVITSGLGNATPCLTTRPNQSLTNSAAADADFNTIYTIPANALGAQNVLVVTVDFSYLTGATAASEAFYLKLGGTKVYTMSAAATPGNNILHNSFAAQFTIIGTAAPSGTSVVDVDTQQPFAQGANHNATASQSLATNGTLAIVPGVTWGSNSNADTLTLRNVTVCWRS